MNILWVRNDSLYKCARKSPMDNTEKNGRHGYVNLAEEKNFLTVVCKKKKNKKNNSYLFK